MRRTHPIRRIALGKRQNLQLAGRLSLGHSGVIAARRRLEACAVLIWPSVSVAVSSVRLPVLVQIPKIGLAVTIIVPGIHGTIAVAVESG